LLALSGGTTPARMLHLLADEDLPWSHTHVFQVDERIASAFDPARNLTQLRAKLLDEVGLPEKQLHAMPVEDADLAAAAARYAGTLWEIAGTPPVLDLIHLGLGADGHTASLVPGDAVLDSDADVAVTDIYQGHRRMTLTYGAIGRARLILWVVTGLDKASMLARLRCADRSIPAGRVHADCATVLADAAAAGSSQ
jgi:6-phosphogluconolactonase